MRDTVRLTGKELFIYYHKGVNIDDNKIQAGGCTNKRILATRTGIGYNILMGHFTRKGRHFYDNGEIVIIRLFTDNIIKGGQSFNRRGRGGMESFLKYVHKSEY